jgi:hypothetical protein
MLSVTWNLDDNPPSKKKQILFESDMTPGSKGRPFGGQAWLIDRSFEIVNNKFLNRHVSFIHIKKSDIEFIVIGCYMPFDDSKKKLESKSNYELSLCLISSIINIAETNNVPFFVIGDFNADLKRDRPFDKILKKFMHDYDLESIIENFVQKTNFTYYHYNNNVKHTHNLDHIFTSKVNTNNIKIRECTIQDDAANMSDHNAVSLLLEFTHNRSHITQDHIMKEREPSINFSNPIIADISTDHESQSE